MYKQNDKYWSIIIFILSLSLSVPPSACSQLYFCYFEYIEAERVQVFVSIVFRISKYLNIITA